MPSIRWIRSVLINGEETTLEIMLGAKHISDKCYVRINTSSEFYFKPSEDSRDGVIQSGIQILKQHFEESTVCYPNGKAYDWL